ncbi:MAG: SDR family oxidoreductase [Rhodospirillales bacterium]|nr:SDR family oxidoreductase [Rhodospirillales bacterium]
MRFEGKAVLITGGATGIGKATAIAFSDEGARVLAASRDAARGAAFEGEMRTAGRAVEFAQADLRDDGAPEALIAEAVRRMGRLDVLFNNAGIHHRFGTLETNNAHWAETMRVNLGAPFILSREAAIVMKDQGGGVIVNVSSDLGVFTEPGKVSYCTSKAALLQMTRAMALDLAPHDIRVVAIAPGDTYTEMTDEKIDHLGLPYDDGMAWIADPVPMKRLASVEEIARAVLFLASDDASYVTGTTLSVDGGTTASGPGGDRPAKPG